MKKKETIFETYVRVICVNCKNKNTNLCCIRRTIDNKALCLHYKKDKEAEKYKVIKTVTAKRHKPIMKNIV